MSPVDVLALRAEERVKRLDVVDGGDALARQGQTSLGRLVEAGHAIEHRRLARAVRADQRGDVAAADLER